MPEPPAKLGVSARARHGTDNIENRGHALFKVESSVHRNILRGSGELRHRRIIAILHDDVAG